MIELVLRLTGHGHPFRRLTLEHPSRRRLTETSCVRNVLLPAEICQVLFGRGLTLGSPAYGTDALAISTLEKAF